MGQALACCSKSEVDTNDIKTQGHIDILDQLKSAQNVRMIVHIQAAVRGFLTRKHVQQLKESLDYDFGPGKRA